MTQAQQHSRRARRKTRLRWKWEGVDRVTESLNRAHQQKNTKEVYRLVKLLGVRHEVTKLKDGQATVANPVQEPEDWKEHFRKLQEGREIAQETVWQNAAQGGEVARWLGEAPTDAEIETCGMQMKNGKAAGVDGFLAEFYKYGPAELRDEINSCVRQMWQNAKSAVAGQEAADWPESWNKGIVVPLWKQKGDRTDKNTWRGITLLSVGSKLLARVVAQRVQAWSEPWLPEAQMGFRRNRSVDDALQVTRRLVEEGTSSRDTGEVMLVRLFDIEKAYPRVSRDSLWRLMKLKGAPDEFISICQALHEYTEYQVRVCQGVSAMYKVDKGLREGCPSSPLSLIATMQL